MATLDEIFQALSPQDQHNLTAFAQFLLLRAKQAGLGAGEAFLSQSPEPDPIIIPEPLDLPRPDEETIIIAVRRLRATYPMLDQRILFDRSADVVSNAMMGLRDTVESIDQLEAIFEAIYQDFVSQLQAEDSRK